MKYIESFNDGMRINGIYLCKTKNIALTKNGKEYGNLTLQDKTGQIEGKIWDLYSPGVRDFEAMDFVEIDALVTLFNGANQLNIRQIAKASPKRFNVMDYFPTSSFGLGEMKTELTGLISSVKEEHLNKLLTGIFGDEDFFKRFSMHSAAKSVHHGFIGGLLEHTLSVATLCSMIAGHYGSKVNRDLLVTGAILHDIGKTRELSAFPQNEYTDEGQLLGHIMIGADMVSREADKIEGFPVKLKNELIHLILSHHGELEYGSPKKPALTEALILAFADNMDAKVETIYEALNSNKPVNDEGWMGYNKLLDTNIRKTSGID